MATLLAFPVLGGLLILQSAVVSQMPLLRGTADLVLLALIAWTLRPRVTTHWQWCVVGGMMVTYISAMPFGVYLAAYLGVTLLTVFLRRRVWKAPVLAMFAATFLGTLFLHGLSLAALWVSGTFLPLWQVFNLVTLPSLLLNVLLAAPVYLVIGDLANWLYPEEIET
jgi:cell shape-determining protein MreD